MCPPPIRTVWILFKLKPAVVTASQPFHHPPVSLVPKLWEIRDCILSPGYRRTLVGTYPRGDGFLDAIARFYRIPLCCWRLFIRNDIHVSRETCMISIKIKFPPSVAIGNPHLLPDCIKQTGSQRDFPSLRTVRESFPSHGAPSIQLPNPVIAPVCQVRLYGIRDRLVTRFLYRLCPFTPHPLRYFITTTGCRPTASQAISFLFERVQ